MCASTSMWWGGSKNNFVRVNYLFTLSFRDGFWLKGFRSLSQFSDPGPEFHLSSNVLGFFSLHQISTQVYIKKALTKRPVCEHTTL